MPKLIDDSVVFEATIEEMLTGGYAGAAMKRIAKRASVSELTLFRRYGSKAELIADAVEFSMSEVTHEKVLAYSGDVSADLLRIVNHFCAHSHTHSRLFTVLMSELPRHPELREVFTIPHRFMRQLAQLLQRYQQEGQLRSDADPMHIVASLTGPLFLNAMGRHHNLTFSPNPIDPETHVAHFLNGFQNAA